MKAPICDFLHDCPFKGQGSLPEFLDLTPYCQIDSTLHHAVVRFDTPLHHAAEKSDSPLQDAAGSHISLLQKAEGRFDYLLRDAAGRLLQQSLT